MALLARAFSDPFKDNWNKNARKIGRPKLLDLIANLTQIVTLDAIVEKMHFKIY